MSSSHSNSQLINAQTRARHYFVAAAVFLLLGFHVGVWAVQISSVATFLQLSLGELGALLSVPAIAGLATLFGGGHLADRFGRKPVLLIGLGGTAVAFVLLGRIDSSLSLTVALLVYGLFISFVDIGSNAVGADYESQHGTKAMNGLHAWFSFGAVLGAVGTGAALASGMSFRTIYFSLAAILLCGAVLVCVSTLPVPAAPEVSEGQSKTSSGKLWRVPGVGLAIVMVCLCFFNDGALENFLSVFLRDTLESGALLAGVGIGSYHLASLSGRLLAVHTTKRLGERRTMVYSALLAAVGLGIAVASTNAAVSIGGMLVVGFAIAPVVPTALSLAARSTPGRSGRAVGLTTAVGYGSFILSPVLIGQLAGTTTLRFGLGALILVSLAMALVAKRWPDLTTDSHDAALHSQVAEKNCGEGKVDGSAQAPTN